MIIFSFSCKKNNSEDFASYLRFESDGVAFNATSNLVVTPDNGVGDGFYIRGDFEGGDLELHLRGEGMNAHPGIYPVKRNELPWNYWYNEKYSNRRGFHQPSGNPLM